MYENKLREAESGGAWLLHLLICIVCCWWSGRCTEEQEEQTGYIRSRKQYKVIKLKYESRIN